MPELPEVETVARQLRAKLLGQKIVGVKIYDPKLQNLQKKRIIGARISDVRRVGKEVALVCEKDRQASFLLVHLRMTGRLLVEGKQKPRPERARAIFELSKKQLIFADTRRFGTMRVVTALPRSNAIDPMTAAFTAERLAELLEGSKQNMKAFLLRQDKIVGLGNIYACEILFAAGVSPLRIAMSLSVKEIDKVHQATKKILKRAIKNCGTTFSDFQDSAGSIGNFQQFLKVYDRESALCRRCGKKIHRISQNGRSTYFCGHCQK